MTPPASNQYIVQAKGLIPNGYKLGGPWKHIPEMPPNSLHPQEERGKHPNALNAIRVRPGKTLAKGSPSSYQQKGLEKAAAELVPLRGQVENDSEIYLKIERERGGERESFYLA